MLNKFLVLFTVVAILFAVCAQSSHCKAEKKQAKESVELLVGKFLDQASYYKLQSSERNRIRQELQTRAPECIDYVVSKLNTDDKKDLRRSLQLLSSLIYSKTASSISTESVGALVNLTNLQEEDDILQQLLMILGRIGPRTKAVEATIYDIIDSTRKPGILRSAAMALYTVNRFDNADHERATKVFLKLLKSDVPSIRAAGARGLGACNADSEEVLEALIKAMDDNYFKVRSAAVYSMRSFGPEAKRAVPKIIELARTETGYGIVPYSLHALQAIGRDDPEVVDVYIEFLKDDDDYISALSHISGLGRGATRAAPYVAKFLNSDKPRERYYAASALGNIGTETQISDLKKVLKDSDKRVKSAARESIQKINQRSKDQE